MSSGNNHLALIVRCQQSAGAAKVTKISAGKGH
jgi:hypothetical protein